MTAPPIDYSTYARIVLSNSGSITELIRKYALIATPSTSAEEFSFVLLTSEQIAQALMNPQNTILAVIHLYAHLIRAYRTLMQAQQQAHQEMQSLEATMVQLRAQQAEQMDASKEALTRDTLKQLDQLYQRASSLVRQINEAETRLLQQHTQLDEMAQKGDAAWEQYREQFLTELAQNIETQGIPLTTLEKNDLLRQDKWIELVRRFTELGIEIPEFLKVNSPNDTTYFAMKTYLTIHASLGRRLLPNQPENIEAYV